MRVILTFVFIVSFILSQGQNFTNKGREFWVGYGHNHLFNLAPNVNSQDMVIYLSAERVAMVKVSIPGTTWAHTYTVPAGSVVVSDLIPKSGANDARITGEGLFRRAVHIESDVPIVAYAHAYGERSSGAAMLLPVETYGYTYVSINATQDYDKDSYSWFYVVASEDNTRVRITPSVETLSRRRKDTPFEITLNKGELYNVMGYNPGTAVGNDVSGSKILSIPGADGKCHPISVFSGSSRTNVCTPQLFAGGGDFMMQQVFPVTAWGARYLTTLTSSTDGPASLNVNRFRIYVQDPTTEVDTNGVRLGGLVNYAYYDISAKQSIYITSNKPVMVAQLIPSATGCGTVGDGDPEIIFLSPMEQAIKNVAFYSTNKEAILTNYVTLVVHNNGLNSLRIDGSTARDHAYPHPGLPDYTVVVKELALTPSQHTITSDSGFNAIAYGLGFAESYGYNAGSYVNNLTFLSQLRNEQSDFTNTHTCPKTPFMVRVLTLYPLSGVTWHFGEVAGFTPNSNVTVNNPTPAGTEIVNGKTYYVYTHPAPALSPGLGTYYLPVTIMSTYIDNCSNSEKFPVEVKVLAGPTADFTVVPGCANSATVFTGTSPETAVDKWLWDFGDGATGTGSPATATYTASGNHNVQLKAWRSADGCEVRVTKTVNIPEGPTAAFDAPAVVCMPTNEAKFVNRSSMSGVPATSLQYHWTFGDGGTATAMHPIHYYAAQNTYAIKLLVTSPAGCKDSAAATITNFANRPAAGFTVNQPAACAHTDFIFTDNSTLPGNAANAIWHWVFGDGTTGTGSAPTKAYKQAGNFAVAMHVISSEGCYSDTVTNTVLVHPIPVVEAGPDVITEPNRPVQLKASVTPATATLTWTPATGLSGLHVLQPMATLMENQRYYLTAVGELGCTGTDSMLVKVFKELKIPNAFSPNGDGHNDTWRIPGLEEYPNATVQVFNRWGQLVFKSTGYSLPWTGNMNGTRLAAGAYYYVIKPNDNGYGVLSGMVMIVR